MNEEIKGLLQALVDGKELQRYHVGNTWDDCTFMGIARATEKAVLTKLVEEQEPDCYAAFGEHDGGLIYLGYTSETVHGVKNRILTGARNEGYKGTIEGRLFALGWQILPLYIRPALPTKPTTKDAIRAVGGIVHSDGNVFFTNMAQIDALREALK